MRQITVCDLEERVAPMQASDTMVVPVIAVIVIGALVVTNLTGHSPDDCSNFNDCGNEMN